MTATILVVDDEPDLETLVTQSFRKRVRGGEIEFLFAHDGVEALKVLSQRPDVDLLLSDINMPRMDGLTLLEELQKVDEKLATLIVSAYGDMANIRTAMNRGAFDFLTKPIDFADLEATIDKTVRHVNRLREVQRRVGRACPCFTIALFFAADRRQTCEGWREFGRSREARCRRALYRYYGLYVACRDHGARGPRSDAQRVHGRHDGSHLRT